MRLESQANEQPNADHGEVVNAPFPQLLHCRLVLAQVELGADKHYRGRWRVVGNFRVPLQVSS